MTLSLIVPGAGYLLQREWGAGLFYACSSAFLATLAWSILATADRLAATLPLLGAPAATAIWALEAIFAAYALLHLSSVHASSAPAVTYRRPLPRFIPVVASMLVPGWGQLLRGKRLRAIAFLGALWAAGAVWLLLSPEAGRLMALFDLFLPEAWLMFVLPIVRLAAPVMVWLIAVYDAAVAEDS
ncbi:MAG: hypothetical protein OEQ13_02655 [Acidobacteriota bacterium]|nr:hypothetical protein [Acidobacteriota bacterium]